MTSMWIAITIISVTGILAGIFAERRDKKQNKRADKEIAALRDQVDRLDRDLRDRVETLERIVTDKQADLRRQFDYLDKAS